jgi:hypothetical protein
MRLSGRGRQQPGSVGDAAARGAVGAPDERVAERVLHLARQECERRRADQRPVERGVGVGELATQLASGLFGGLGGVAGGEEVGAQVVV